MSNKKYFINDVEVDKNEFAFEFEIAFRAFYDLNYLELLDDGSYNVSLFPFYYTASEVYNLLEKKEQNYIYSYNFDEFLKSETTKLNEGHSVSYRIDDEIVTFKIKEV
jgi:hypothetical protein